MIHTVRQSIELEATADICQKEESQRKEKEETCDTTAMASASVEGLKR